PRLWIWVVTDLRTSASSSTTRMVSMPPSINDGAAASTTSSGALARGSERLIVGSCSSSPAKFALGPRLLDETIDHAEPEAGAFADALGREERIEDLVADSGVNAAAGIAHRDHHVVPGSDLAIRAAGRFVEHDVAGFQR